MSSNVKWTNLFMHGNLGRQSRVSNNKAENERYTNSLRDGLVEKMRRAGISVNTDWQEGERVLARENGRVSMMGSRVDKKQLAISSHFEGKELTDKQRVLLMSILEKKRRFLLKLFALTDVSSFQLLQERKMD